MSVGNNVVVVMAFSGFQNVSTADAQNGSVEMSDDDKWIPRPSTFRIVSPPMLGDMSLVSDLKLPSGRWNESLVRESFLAVDAEGSGLSGSEAWWKYLWLLKVPPKVKLHVWRGCKNWLPVLTVLAKRGLEVERWCPFCHQKQETIAYALWFYVSLKQIRGRFVKLKEIPLLDNMPLLDFLILCRNLLSSDEMALLYVVLWRIWFRRNALVHNSSVFNATEIVDWAVNFIEEDTRINARTYESIFVSWLSLTTFMAFQH
ncbi:hypothetical protein Q3G72_006154 [Acer saccharum]|nr:hypothetical protein Q3G72_006154 [Acer saccharum]